MADKNDSKNVPALAIRSVPEHFYRAGHKWTRDLQIVPTSKFKPEQIKALKAELNLVVTESEITVKTEESSKTESEA